MRFIALRELDMGDGRILPPGDEVPEAANWDRSWFLTGHVGAYPDDMVASVQKALADGAEGVVHAAQADHANLRGALMAQGAGAPKGDDKPAEGDKAPEGDKPTGKPLPKDDPPPGKEKLTADAGETPHHPGVFERVLEAVGITATTEEADEVGEGDEPAAPTTDDPTTTTRRRRRR